MTLTDTTASQTLSKNPDPQENGVSGDDITILQGQRHLTRQAPKEPDRMAGTRH